ncbi:MAG: 4'-phosphopantetheinyl transferase superfamily protein [Deltaproteobacteria bacterium]|nr:4'-phosphopantetheinyl transferase superfamily protein [Deltaproteobacteria bacterium]
MRLFAGIELDHPHGAIRGVVLEDELAAPLELILPEELEATRAMGPRRRTSFVAGRVALRRALDAVGAPVLPILPDERGQPITPEGYAGSISHKIRDVVAIARRGSFGVGIDVEHRLPNRSRIADKVLTPRELSMLGGLSENDRWLGVVVRFSIKESLYKAVHPFVRRYVEFLDAEVELDRFPLLEPHEPGVFSEARVTLSAPEGPFVIEATWHLGELIVSTARVQPGPAQSEWVNG